MYELQGYQFENVGKLQEKKNFRGLQRIVDFLYRNDLSTITSDNIEEYFDDDVPVINKHFFQKLTEKDLNDSYLTERRKHQTHNPNSFDNFTYEIFCHLEKIIKEPNEIPLVIDRIERDFFARMYNSWEGKSRFELFCSPINIHILSRKNIRNEELTSKVWENFLNHLDNYVDLQDFLQFILFNFCHLYGLDTVTCKTVHPLRSTDVWSIKVARRPVTKKEFTPLK